MSNVIIALSAVLACFCVMSWLDDGVVFEEQDEEASMMEVDE